MPEKGLMMIETTVESIRVSLVTQHRVVILKEVDGERHLPIWIGVYEAEAIAMELQGITPTRPLPYDLMQTMIGELDAIVDRILITDLHSQVYFARIVLTHQGRTIEIDSRPSDAIAIAVRAGCPILVDERVMSSAGVSVDSDDDAFEIEDTAEPEATPAEPAAARTAPAETAAPEYDEKLSVFRDFINSLDLEGLDDSDRKRSN